MPLEINYWNIQGHESMLLDTVRCETFRQAIFDTVTPGCTVLDIGAGTGILSLFAAQAGAKVVYAVERTHIAELARRIVKENGYDDRINVLQNDMETLELPEKVDVIVSEWLGGYGVDENLLPVVIHARDRWLKPGGKMIPAKVTSWLAPVYDERLQQDIDFWNSDPYGVDLNAISKIIVRLMDCSCNHVKEEHLISTPQLMWEIDGMTYSCEGANQPFHSRLKFVADRNGDGQCNALAAWFSAALTEQIVLSNGPSEPDTHWGRSVFSIGKSISLKGGKRLDVDFTHKPQGKGQSKTAWAIEVDDYSFHSEDITVLTRRNAES